MKDVGGSSWADINSAVREITGVQVGGSTLAVRYARIKANMQVFEKSDVCFFSLSGWVVDGADGLMRVLYFQYRQELVLLQSKKDIEDRFDVEKWQKISEAIESKSGNKYSAAAVQKKFKEMAKRGNGSGVQAEE